MFITPIIGYLRCSSRCSCVLPRNTLQLTRDCLYRGLGMTASERASKRTISVACLLCAGRVDISACGRNPPILLASCSTDRGVWCVLNTTLRVGWLQNATSNFHVCAFVICSPRPSFVVPDFCLPPPQTFPKMKQDLRDKPISTFYTEIYLFCLRPNGQWGCRDAVCLLCC